MNLLVYITTPGENEAVDIGRYLVESGLAAGVNITGPGRSIYRWRGEIYDTPQWLVFLQTESGVFKDLEKAVLARHSHITPCIVAMPLQDGYAPFLEWITDNCTKASKCE